MSVNLPVPYVLRYSARARRLQLKITAMGRLELVVPIGVSEKKALCFLHDQQAWVTQKTRLGLIRSSLPTQCIRPEQLELRAISQTIDLAYHIGAKRSSCRQVGPVLNIFSQSYDDSIVFLLKRFLKSQAERFIAPMLRSFSLETGFSYRNLHFRAQKTRWGSCSSYKDISLNYLLLFFPPDVLRYVCIHELCHTQEMNHSLKFWHLVSQHVPNYLHLKQQLKDFSQYLPTWICL